MTSGGGWNAPGRRAQHAAHVERGAHEDGETAPLLGARASRQARGDLVLHHEDDALEPVGVLDRGPQEGPGDRVRQVPAEDARRVRGSEERREIDGLRVFLEHAHARPFERLGQQRDEIAIALDGRDRRGSLGEQRA